MLKLVGRIILNLTAVCLIFSFWGSSVSSETPSSKADREEWWCDPDFEQFKPAIIAVLPMVNMSLESDVSEFLQRAVYDRLLAKGYRKTADSSVNEVMKTLGIQVPEQLAGISYEKLGRELQCDAVLQGQVNQSAAQHAVVYDAVVVSCSLQLVACPSGKVLWRCEQWRTAHRQWQLDPFNLLLTTIVHAQASRDERISWLVQEMLKTLPEGPVVIIHDNLFERATEISSESESGTSDETKNQENADKEISQPKEGP